MSNRKSLFIGMMIIELMFALSISLVILAMLTTLYMATQKNHQIQAGLNRIQENARTAFQVMRADIQSAGYIGCAKLTMDFPLTTYQNFTITPQNKITGTENEIVIRHAGQQSANLLTVSRDSTLTITAKPHFSANEMAIISDCKRAEIFSIDHVSENQGKQIITTQAPLHNRYTESAMVSHFEIHHYYVKPHKKSLFVTKNFQKNSEVIEGVEALALMYDIEENGEIFTVTADQVSDWAKVMAVRVSLSLLSGTAFPFQKTWYAYVALRE